MDFSKIKIIIWDLDDTFWNGTLSEGGIKAIENNILLVKNLTDHGIINTICSKNDYEPAIEQLDKLGVKDYFVFSSINWEAKGPRISSLLKDMGLRATNALFIDDNIVNLNEAKHYEPDLNIFEPSIIPDIANYVSSIPAKDISHSRLDNYKVLEKKHNSKKTYSNNESFLYASDTRVTIKHDCIENIDRIHELILRTNQLNYTKLRSNRKDLETLLSDNDTESGYVTVKDAFGDYGIVGFYALKDNKCIHFLFSCRTIGQGVEQYVYATIGYPILDVQGIVINNVTNEPAPKWINQEKTDYSNIIHKVKGKIIFKGPCDLMGLTSYLKAENLICELTYFSDTRHNNMEHQGCMTNYIQIPKLSPDDINYLVENCIFNDSQLYKTSLYDNDVKLIFLSSLHEFHFGIYRHKDRNIKVAFGEWNHPMTDSNEWQGYINNSIWTSSNKFTHDFLSEFSQEWEFIGRKKYDDYITEIEHFLTLIAPDAHVCIFMGSEIPYNGKTTDAWENRHIIHKEINHRLRSLAKNNPRLHLIDYTELISSPKDYTDSINHLQRYIHYKAAERANEIIQNVLGAKIKQRSRLKIVTNQLRDWATYCHLKLINLKNKISQS